MIFKDLSEAKADVSELLEAAQNGEEVLISKENGPLAKLVKYPESGCRRIPGKLQGKISIGSDFDSLPRDIVECFGGESN